MWHTVMLLLNSGNSNHVDVRKWCYSIVLMSDLSQTFNISSAESKNRPIRSERNDWNCYFKELQCQREQQSSFTNGLDPVGLCIWGECAGLLCICYVGLYLSSCSHRSEIHYKWIECCSYPLSCPLSPVNPSHSPGYLPQTFSSNLPALL